MPATILRPYFLMARNRYRFRHREELGYSKELLMGLVVLIIMGCIFAAVYMGLHALGKQPIFLVLLPPKLIELSLYYFFILLIVSNTVAATGNIYTSERMSLLLPCPIPMSRLFFAKFLETMIETGIMFYVFTFPAVLAFAIRLDTSPFFLPAYFFLSIPFLAIPVAIGIILATLMSRTITLIWRRGAVFVVALIATFIYGVHALSDRLEAVRTSQSGARTLATIAGLYENPNPSYLPSRWISDVLCAFLGSPVSDPAAKLILLFVSAIGLISICYLVFDFLMLRVRSLAGMSQRFDRRSAARFGDTDLVRKLLETIARAIPFDQQTRAIVLKDLTSLVRDRAQALQLLLYLGIAALYVTVFNFMALGLQLDLIAGQVWRAVLATLNILFSGFIFTTLLTRLVYPSVSLEGRAFWILQVTPIEIPQLLKAKLFCWLPLTTLLLISLLVAGTLAIGAQGNYIAYTAVFGFFLSIGCTGLAIGLGARFATFDWESPNQLTVSLGTLVLLLTGVGLLFLMIIPAGIITFFLVIPKLQEIVGFTKAFLLMSTLLFLAIYTNILVAHYACKSGALRLTQRRTVVA